MANRYKLRLTGRPSREPGGIIIDQFRIKISSLEPSKATQKHQPQINTMAMSDVAEPSTADVAPIPTDPPVGEIDSTPIPTEPPVGELETAQPTPIV
jgi:hypothetical protein